MQDEPEGEEKLEEFEKKVKCKEILQQALGIVTEEPKAANFENRRNDVIDSLKKLTTTILKKLSEFQDRHNDQVIKLDQDPKLVERAQIKQTYMVIERSQKKLFYYCLIIKWFVLNYMHIYFTIGKNLDPKTASKEEKT